MRELPLGWAWTSLGEIAADRVDTSGPRANHFTYLDITSINGGKKKVSEPKQLAKSEAPSRARQNVQCGDVLVSLTRPNLNAVAMVGSEYDGAVASTAFYVLRAVEVQPAWLYYLVQTQQFITAMCARVQGALYPAIRSADVMQYRVPVAPLAEQRRIVAEIDQYLRRIDVASQALATTLGKVGSYVAHMFERAASEAPCAEFRQMLAVPLANGRSVPTATSGFPVLRLTSIRNARVDLSECKMGAWDARQAEPFLVTEGDLLIVRGNGSLHLVGRAGLVQEVSSQVAFPDTLIRAKLDRSVALPAYVARAWHTRIVRRQIEAAARTSAGIYKINQTDIENLRIPLPPLPVQEHLGSSADAIEGLAAQAHVAIERSIHLAVRLRQAILKKAFEGKLVPQDPNDEPASVLIERIRAARAHAIR